MSLTFHGKVCFLVHLSALAASVDPRSGFKRGSALQSDVKSFSLFSLLYLSIYIYAPAMPFSSSSDMPNFYHALLHAAAEALTILSWRLSLLLLASPGS